MSQTDYVIPTFAAAIFSLVGYVIMTSERQHAEIIGEPLYVVFRICAVLFMMIGLLQLSDSMRPAEKRVAAKAGMAKGSNFYDRTTMRGTTD